MKRYKIHKSALAFEEYDITELKKSIEEKGQLTPILLWNNQIVDGRHRYKACTELSIEPMIRHLPEDTTEETLPRVVLDIQILGRGIDSTFASCEVVLYLERTKEKQKDVIERYPDVKKDSVANLTVIKEVRPLWFKTLRDKKKVEWDKGQYSNSLRKLADICKQEKKGAIKEETTKLEFKTKPDNLSELKHILSVIKKSKVEPSDIIDFLKLEENEQVDLITEW